MVVLGDEAKNQTPQPSEQPQSDPSCLCLSPWAPAPSAAASEGREIHPETIQALVLQKPAQLQRSIWLIYQNSD